VSDQIFFPLSVCDLPGHNLFNAMFIAAALSFLSVLTSVLLVVWLGTAISMPISSGHAVVGSLVGVALLSGGPKGVSWIAVRDIVSAWTMSLVIGIGVAFAVKYALRIAGSSYRRYKIVLPLLAGMCASGMLGVVLAVGPLRTLASSSVFRVAALESVTFFVAGVAASAFIRRNAGTSVSNAPVYLVAEDDDEENVDGNDDSEQCSGMYIVEGRTSSGEAYDADMDVDDEYDNWAGSFVLDEQAPIFRVLLTVTSAAVAFAHGSSDVSSHAAGTFHGIVQYYRSALIDDPVMVAEINGAFTLLMRSAGASAMALGLAFCGGGVVETVGSDLHRNRMTYARGFSAQFSAASAVICAKAIGLPISASHSLIAAITVSNVAFVPATERARDGIMWLTLQRIAELAVLTPMISGILAIIIRLLLMFTFE
jgi:phosphate/sulfate permease